ncbi:SLC13 family permease [Arthrobacter cheniae]|uniref:SLC13 family permease n=1 Tax=Arthrobacter cheniae TaxID=1258888 RepID=A0A3A5M923_9MICC|nr:SLC13 family permease [Arthrobacter cheniae]RJT75104.1 SLC13 family permease [Arthrobacter cheniae]
MTLIEHSTTPPSRIKETPGIAPAQTARARAAARRSLIIRVVAATLGLAIAAAVIVAAQQPDTDLSPQGAITLMVFVLAVWLWIFTAIDDTYIALGAATVLVLTGTMDTSALFSTLGEETIWLLLAAFVIAAGVRASGLANRGAAFIITGATTPRQLAHLTTLALVVTTFAVPSTSGRAALALPVFLALRQALAGRTALIKALAILFPSVILLSAVGSFLGAGAHLITSQILETATGQGFDFATWLLLGLPLALVASHLCAEIVLRMFTSAKDRGEKLRINSEDLEQHSDTPVTGPLTVAESRAALLLGAVVVLWCTEPLHGLHPALVALIGALVAASPSYGSVDLAKGLKSVPWSLLLFMAATLALGNALVSTGAAEWLAGGALEPIQSLGIAAAPLFVVLVVLISTFAHLVIQSRSARSAVLIPIVIALSPTVGVDPMAAAFASTAAAGFCHTLTSSAKPVAMFAAVDGIETYSAKDLLRLSTLLAPVNVALVLLFSFLIWPLLGLPLFP